MISLCQYSLVSGEVLLRAISEKEPAGPGPHRFTRKELERLLRRDCREVSSRFVSYWEDVEPDGLFVAWLAVK